MKPVLIIKAGSAIAGVPAEWGDFEHWIGDGAGLDPDEWLSCAVVDGKSLPDVTSVSGIIITGSPAMVTDRLAWSEYTAQWLRAAIAASLPVLGICYGHQLLAHTLGGQVIYHPMGREIGTTEIVQTPAARVDLLFSEMPQQYPVHVTHSQTVGVLPEFCEIMAANSFDPHHAVRYGDRIWGVQFHPEFSVRVMRKYLELRSEQVSKEGLDVKSLMAGITDNLSATTLLVRFANICRDFSNATSQNAGQGVGKGVGKEEPEVS